MVDFMHPSACDCPQIGEAGECEAMLQKDAVRVPAPV